MFHGHKEVRKGLSRCSFMGKNLEKDDDNDGYDNDDSIRMENRCVNPVTKKIEEEEVYIFIEGARCHSNTRTRSTGK